MSKKINASRFYGEWKGHPLADVATFRSAILSQRPTQPIIYLAGDSSLDNKAWVSGSSSVDVPEIYQAVLDKPRPKPDVAFWLNHFLGSRATTLNLAVEESLLRERDHHLLEHDQFIRDNIRAEDILVVSVGANDIALRPNAATARNMFQLAWLTPRFAIEHGLAWPMGYFRKMFKDQVQHYISRMVDKRKPKAVVVCMIYYPLESGASNQSSWADASLKILGYGRNPGQLQTAIAKMYETATTQIEIPGTKIVPCALYECLDGKREEDYTARVEPSTEGGRKMALHLKTLLDPLLIEEPD
jgi:hypothetical protein